MKVNATGGGLDLAERVEALLLATLQSVSYKYKVSTGDTHNMISAIEIRGCTPGA